MSDNFAVSSQSNKNLIITKGGKTYEKPSIPISVAAFIAANTAGSVVYGGINKLGSKPFESVLKNIDNIDIDVFKRAADEAFNSSGLSKKGVTVVDGVFENYNIVRDSINEALLSWKNKIPFLRNIKDQQVIEQTRSVLEGKNAFYVKHNKQILINKDKLGIALFHEMGHALNYNKAGLGNILIKMKSPFSLLIPIAVLTALCKRKKADGEESQGVFDKTTTFIKNNCGKLAFLGMLPSVLEEGLASIKGAKLAKNFLSAENLKTLNKFNSKTWLTYLSLAVGSGLCAVTASKVRDFIAHPKEINSEN